MIKAAITGWGGYVPSNMVENDFLSTIVDTNDEWIRTRTGIQTRHVSEGENTSHLATEAAKQAISESGVEAGDIELIIVATITPDSFTPATACLVQAALGADKAFAFDVTAGCSGFIYGLNIATSFIEKGQVKNALVIGAEVLSKVVDWSDRSTCVLFGDGAGAVVLQASEDSGIMATYCGSAGDTEGVLNIPAVNVRNPFVGESKVRSFLTMKGQDVFKFAVRAMRNSINEVLKQSHYTMDDIKYVIPHQANARIIDLVSRKMKVSKEKFYLNLHEKGNTSAASIPLALHEMLEKGMVQKGDKIIMVGFGGGLTWGAVLVEI